MEYSQVTGSEENEDCQSSESGWTMYLGSPQNDVVSVYDDKNDDENSTIEVEEENDNKVDQNDSDDSDDSMTSDASSGPKIITERRQGNEGKENVISLDKKGKKKQIRSEIRKKK